MSKKKIIVMITSVLLLSGIVLLLLNIRYPGIFFLIVGLIYPVLCAFILSAKKHVLKCPACGFEVPGARKDFQRTGLAKCPKCGALLLSNPEGR